MSSFTIPVRTHIDADQFKTLREFADENHTTVGNVIAELVRRSLQPKPQPAPRNHVRGRPTKYTPELGERIRDSRRFGRSYNEIGAEEHIAPSTAKAYMRRAEADARAAVIAGKEIA